MDPKTLLRAAYMYKECETRIELAHDRNTKEYDAARDACDARYKAMESLCNERLTNCQEACDAQIQAVTAQTETVLNTMTTSYAKKVNALTKLDRPDKTWHIVGGVVGGAAAIGLGILIGYVIPR